MYLCTCVLKHFGETGQDEGQKSGRTLKKKKILIYSRWTLSESYVLKKEGGESQQRPDTGPADPSTSHWSLHFTPWRWGISSTMWLRTVLKVTLCKCPWFYHITGFICRSTWSDGCWLTLFIKCFGKNIRLHIRNINKCTHTKFPFTKVKSTLRVDNASQKGRQSLVILLNFACVFLNWD